MDVQEQIEFKNDLAALLSSSGWRTTIKPSLERRCEEIKRRLATGKRLQLEEIRELQSKYSLLVEFIEDPVRFLLAGVE